VESVEKDLSALKKKVNKLGKKKKK